MCRPLIWLVLLHAATTVVAQELPATSAISELRLTDLELDTLVPGAFEALSPTALVIDRHTVPDHAIAYYLPPQRLEVPLEEATTGTEQDPAAATAAEATATEATAAETAAAEPAATIELPPRLLVFERLYAPRGRLRAIHELPVDAAEYLLHALIEALLDLRHRGDPGSLELLAPAEGLFDDLPEERRREAAFEAYADFGAHLISLANEINKRLADVTRREQICSAAQRGIGLFALWNGAFERQPFPGSYYQAGRSEPGALPGERRYSAISLPKSLRLAFVTQLLRRDWHGDVFTDLMGDTCAPKG